MRARKLWSISTVIFVVLCLRGAPAYAQQSCDSWPQSTGTCLCLLRLALNLPVCTTDCETGLCEPQCACEWCECDLDGNNACTAKDALICLKYRTGGIEPAVCPCTEPELPCTSARITSAAGSVLDSGWNGLAHRKPLVSGASIDVDIVRRCVDDPLFQCQVDSDCPTGVCRSTCDCDDPSSSNCAIAGPYGQSRCHNTQAECSTNADCGVAGQCVRFFGPPLPLSAANTPACVTTFFATDLTGTYDTKTGHGSSSTFLRARVHLGIAQDLPCPRCGRLDDDPQIGDELTCEGGPNDEKPCTVEAISEIFGGVSSACPPEVEDNVSGQGLVIIFSNLTTDEASVTAAIPCVAPNLCTDDGFACTTNADCKRCVDTGAPCSSPADCGGGRCAEAPDPEQPITCGFWCHCGFCEDDPSRPCTSDAECDEGEHCNPGDSSSGIQERPNGCSDLVCGRAAGEECCAQGEPGCDNPTPLVGECSEKRWVTCTSNVDCAIQNGGECLALKRPCFGSVIERTGTASAIGNHCIDDPEVSVCTSNSDCNVGLCVADTAEPTFVGLFCVPKTASGGINAAGGIPGPGAISFQSTILFCRCGDGEIGCTEECDDGNTDSGDDCDQACRSEPSALPASSPACELPTGRTSS